MLGQIACKRGVALERISNAEITKGLFSNCFTSHKREEQGGTDMDSLWSTLILRACCSEQSE